MKAAYGRFESYVMLRYVIMCLFQLLQAKIQHSFLRTVGQKRNNLLLHVLHII